MLSKKSLREIKEFEKAGIDVTVVGSDEKLDHSIQEEENNLYCNKCSAFRLLPDPDLNDWFRDGDMKAVCLEVNGVIKGSLETPSEWTHICKPLYCPKLGYELSNDEKKKAQKDLDSARKRI